MGVPSVAVSLAARPPMLFEPAAAFAVAVCRHVLAQGLPARSLLNVNVPDTRGRPVEAFRWSRGGLRDYGHQVIVQQDPRGRPMYWIGSDIGWASPGGGRRLRRGRCRGLAAITPIHLDMTHHALLASWGTTELPGFERR
jgi:5'-nucleotidase